jgi:hypothetical protein
VVRELQSEARASETVASGQGGTALVRGLRERVTEQERTIEELGELIQGLEGRLEGLETAEPQAPVYRGPAVPRLERYVVPARRGLEAKVRTGWSAERLVRELGEPAQVTGLSSGGAIWTYADGRSVTVDEKGRVVSSMGF